MDLVHCFRTKKGESRQRVFLLRDTLLRFHKEGLREEFGGSMDLSPLKSIAGSENRPTFASDFNQNPNQN